MVTHGVERVERKLGIVMRIDYWNIKIKGDLLKDAKAPMMRIFNLYNFTSIQSKSKSDIYHKRHRYILHIVAKSVAFMTSMCDCFLRE